MKIKDLSSAQFKRYFEARLQGKKFARSGSAASYMALCPFHDDRTKSLSINIDKGVWKCHAGTSCGSGGIIEFEKKFSGTMDDQTAISNIAELIGEPQIKMGGGQRYETIYPYTDESGILLFQVVRYPGKKFVQRRPCPDCQSKSRTCENPDCRSGWIYKEITKARTVLYHLPEVITAREIVVCEGEKDADNMREWLGLPKLDGWGKAKEEACPVIDGVAATTAPRGAGKWLDAFSPYLAGKKVVIVPDNDDKGEQHAAVVAHSVYRYAAGVKIVKLPDLPPKGDLTDFKEKHPALTDFVAEVNKAPTWKPPEREQSLLIDICDFVKDAPREISWIVEGIIEKGSNGVVSARPKCGKSFSILDLAIALASGQSWMPGQSLGGFHIDRQVRTTYVSREDNPFTTQWRAIKIIDGRQIPSMEELRGWLTLNTRMQSHEMKLDNPDLLNALIRDLDKARTEFVILDVFRKLHDAEENDNTEMQKIMDCVLQIQEKVGCQIAIVHHDNKREDATLTERLRGASAIAGFAEWVIGMKIVNQEAPKHEWVREMEIELKAALPPDNFHYMIKDQTPPKTGICLERVYWEAPKKNRRKADSLAAAGQQSLPKSDDDDQIPF